MTVGENYIYNEPISVRHLTISHDSIWKMEKATTDGSTAGCRHGRMNHSTKRRLISAWEFHLSLCSQHWFTGLITMFGFYMHVCWSESQSLGFKSEHFTHEPSSQPILEFSECDSLHWVEVTLKDLVMWLNYISTNSCSAAVGGPCSLDAESPHPQKPLRQKSFLFWFKE